MKTKKSEKELLGILNRRNDPNYKPEVEQAKPRKPILSRYFEGTGKTFSASVDQAKEGSDKSGMTLFDGTKISQIIVDACEKAKNGGKDLMEELKKYAPKTKDKGISTLDFSISFGAPEGAQVMNVKPFPYINDDVMAFSFDEHYISIRVRPHALPMLNAFLYDNVRASFGNATVTVKTFDGQDVTMTFEDVRLYSLISDTFVKNTDPFDIRKDRPFGINLKFTYERAY